jgi:hypothetical protein
MTDTDILLPAGTVFVVTGITVDGRRFRVRTPSYYHATGINLYRGTVWYILPNETTRHILYRVFN